ncbi:hypothetical protein GTPT_2418 [Tatumella ptyseos ATCC 33301]|uniref:Uncharacterized protein n=1 Tax=Tatumella ptyseos ATCC 33301 TaxID=1005995 RepID=A0A085JDW1_9GAMM|nr:hypothetical protein GTPT_2418 [Tatumella ptyseos ATCC 33301]
MLIFITFRNKKYRTAHLSGAGGCLPRQTVNQNSATAHTINTQAPRRWLAAGTKTDRFAVQIAD